jgi:protease IV
MSEETAKVNQTILLLAEDYLKDKKRKRRWRHAFKILILLALCFAGWKLFSTADLGDAGKKPHTALIDIKGGIFASAPASADNIAKALHRAYKDKGTKGILLRINSPGGSPVQADFIFHEIRRQRHLHPNIKVYAACTDLCASAAYYIASAADDIYADRSSLVGSIGVLFNGFGFVDTMQKIGVQRRLITAGQNKGFLDPFSPQKPEDVARLKNILSQVHTQFEKSVIEGRGKRLKVAGNADIFSGLIWTGEQSKKMGLIDAFGSPGYVAREVIKAPHILDYTVKPNYFAKLAKNFADSFADGLFSRIGTRKHLMVGEI